MPSPSWQLPRNITRKDYYGLYGIFAATQFPWAGGEEFASMKKPREKFAPLAPDAEPKLAASKKHHPQGLLRPVWHLCGHAVSLGRRGRICVDEEAAREICPAGARCRAQVGSFQETSPARITTACMASLRPRSFPGPAGKNLRR